jgi:hypothetical protein
VDLKGVDLSEANLMGARLGRAELQWANLISANLTGADLTEVRLMGSNLSRAIFCNARLHQALINDARAWYADFSGADLSGAYLWGTDFREATFYGANLTGADLRNAQLVGTIFRHAKLINCNIFGISAWDLELEGAEQRDLNINRADAPPILIGDIEVGQFLYLLLDNPKLRRVIDTITSKVVLILGRFSEAQKPMLDHLRDELRNRNLVPVLFDFTVPTGKDETGVVETLARMARFVVADLTDPKSIGHELATIVPYLPTTPVVPLRLAGSGGYSMFARLQRYPWVLPVYEYNGPEEVMQSIELRVIGPAEDKRKILTPEVG